MTIQEAKKAGILGFHSGYGRAPMLNGEFIKAACNAKGRTTELLKAYTYGYTIACNANAAIEVFNDNTFPSVKEVNAIMGWDL